MKFILYRYLLFRGFHWLVLALYGITFFILRTYYGDVSGDAYLMRATPPIMIYSLIVLVHMLRVNYLCRGIPENQRSGAARCLMINALWAWNYTEFNSTFVFMQAEMAKRLGDDDKDIESEDL